jgi:hypothetical protein
MRLWQSLTIAATPCYAATSQESRGEEVSAKSAAAFLCTTRAGQAHHRAQIWSRIRGNHSVVRTPGVR